MYIKLRCPLRLLLLSTDDLALPPDTWRGAAASTLMLPKLLAERFECVDCREHELPPLRPM
jgi:hypothetical protein